MLKNPYFFLTTSDEVQSNSSDYCIHHYVKISNLVDPELQLINTKPVIKNKLKGLLNELKKIKFQTVLVLDYKKKNCQKNLPLQGTKLIASNSDIDEAFKSMHQSIITKTKNYSCKDWIILDAIINHNITIFEYYYNENKQYEKIIER